MMFTSLLIFRPIKPQNKREMSTYVNKLSKKFDLYEENSTFKNSQRIEIKFSTPVYLVVPLHLGHILCSFSAHFLVPFYDFRKDLVGLDPKTSN